MSALIINRTDPYNDEKVRAAWARYSESHPNHLGHKFGNQYARIDCYVNTIRGIFAVELARNSCWAVSMKYPEDYIRIPVRKLDYFRECLTRTSFDGREVPIITCRRGYFVLLNVLCNYAAVLKFVDILRSNYIVNTVTSHREGCEVALIPKMIIIKYIEIP